MAQKPKQKPKTKLTDKKQSERFKQIARELDIEKNESFDQLVVKIAATKRASKA